MEPETALIWDQVRAHAGSYPPNAFAFVQEGLRHTVEQIFDVDMDDVSFDDAIETGRHVSGEQLCLGLRNYAIEQYGPLARTVLSHWHITSTEDFGRIVFALVDAGLMSKTDDDRLEDFLDVFDFQDAFSEPVEIC